MFRLFLDPSINAKAWYLWCFASFVSVGPFLNIFFYERGLSKAQVGLIGALRPWTSAPASFAWAALADRLHAHRTVLLCAFTASCALKMLLLLPRSFSGLLAVVLAAEVLAAPVGVLADAAVMRICEKESDYGKYRLWGAVGWGTFASVAGWLTSHLGIRWAFYIQAVLALPCLFHGARLFATAPPRRRGSGCSLLGPAAHSAAAAERTAPPQRQRQRPHQSHEHHQVSPDTRQRCCRFSGNCKGGHVHVRDRCDSSDYEDGSAGDGIHPEDLEEGHPLLPAQPDSRWAQSEVLHRAPATVAPAAAAGVPGPPGSGDGASAAAAVAGSTPTATCSAAVAAREGCREYDAAAVDVACGASGGRGGGEGGGDGGGNGAYFWRQLGPLLRRGDVVLFLVTTTVMGYGFGTIDSFLFLYLGEMGATGTLMGLTLTITCAAEVPAFQLQDRLLDSWGVPAVLDLVQAVYVVRLALYAALPYAGNVMWVLPVEVLHGITFACGWGAGTVNCKLLAPPEMAATLQGAFQGLYFGLGYGLGSLVGGWQGTKLGWQGMFALAAVTMLSFWMCTVAARRVLRALRPPASNTVEKGIELAHALNTY